MDPYKDLQIESLLCIRLNILLPNTTYRGQEISLNLVNRIFQGHFLIAE